MFLAVGLCGIPVSAGAQTRPAAPPASGTPRAIELLVEVSVNGAPAGGTSTILREPDGTFLATRDDLASWRLRVPASAAVVRDGRTLYPLVRIPGLDAKFDESRLVLALTADASLLDGTTLDAAAAAPPPPTLPALGGFFNYNVLGERFRGDTRFAGLFEAGLFGPHGVAISSFSGTDTPIVSGDVRGERVVRLDTYLRQDDPAAMRTLIVGDSINAPGTWGRSVRFGGIQYGTNFLTQPGFITFPLLGASGVATVPSVVDVLVDNVPVTQQRVPPGPFSVRDIPPITGAGEVQLVVRDALGREQTISQPFYASQSLLREGLSEFSVEFGSVRYDYGLQSNSYQGILGSGTYRRGISDSLTLGGRAEAYRDVTAAGVDASWLIAPLGVLSGALAGSHSDAGSGVLAQAGAEHRARRFSVAARGTWATSEFRQVGLFEGQNPLARQLLASASYSAGRAGAFSVAYASLALRGEAPRDLASAAWSVAVARLGFFSLNATRSFGDNPTTSLFAFFTVPLGQQTSLTLGADRRIAQNGDTREAGTVTLQRSLPPGPGFGYRIFANTERDAQAGVGLQSDYGTVLLDVARAEGETAGRVNMLGGVGVIAGHPFIARQLTDSFGLVRVGDYAGIPVLQDNQVIGRTDANGYVVLPRLRAYDRNPVSVDLSEVPLDARIDGSKLVAVPYYRSGVLYDFPVKRTRGAVLHLELEDGAPLPAGATVTVLETGETFPVAYRGEVYVSGLAETNRLRATWNERSCEIEVRYPQTQDPLPDLGRFGCPGVTQ